MANLPATCKGRCRIRIKIKTTSQGRVLRQCKDCKATYMEDK